MPTVCVLCRVKASTQTFQLVMDFEPLHSSFAWVQSSYMSRRAWVDAMGECCQTYLFVSSTIRPITRLSIKALKKVTGKASADICRVDPTSSLKVNVEGVTSVSGSTICHGMGAVSPLRPLLLPTRLPRPRPLLLLDPLPRPRPLPPGLDPVLRPVWKKWTSKVFRNSISRSEFRRSLILCMQNCYYLEG